MRERKYRPDRPDFLPEARDLDAPKICWVDACTNKVQSFGLCPKHYYRWRANGSVYRPSTPLEKYLAVVDKRGDNECWLYKPRGAKPGAKGYGNIRLGKRQVSTHRLAWELFVGPIPDGLYVLHTCDTPQCSNPNHLWLGTHKDNMEDKKRKGRNRNGAS